MYTGSVNSFANTFFCKLACDSYAHQPSYIEISVLLLWSLPTITSSRPSYRIIWNFFFFFFSGLQNNMVT
jgi:hypothetical protein